MFQSNTLLDVNWETGMVRRLDLSSFLESAAKTVTSHFKTQQVRVTYLVNTLQVGKGEGDTGCDVTTAYRQRVCI